VLFDILFLAYILLQTFLGIRFGFFRRLVHFGGFYLGMLLARAVSPGAAQAIGWSAGDHPPDGHFGMFLLIVVGVTVAAEVLAFLYGSALEIFNAMVLDRVLGGATAVITAVLELAVLLYLFGFLLFTPPPGGRGHADISLSTADQISRSYLAKGLTSVEGVATFIYLPVLPSEPGRYWASTYS
jgi:uncharacterized membrane protein required for colicin V production